jgi:predicted nucleic acid-binding protein
MIFCDTSAVAKVYVPERESAAIRRLVESEDEVCVSELARVELMSVFHRRVREGRWSRADFRTATRQFTMDDVSGFWTWLPLDGAIVEAAARAYASLPDTVFLRPADCLHMVTALHHHFTVIHTYDAHQSAAAAALGLQPAVAAEG